jgi:transposase
MKRHEMSDEQWALVNPLLPRTTTGRTPRDPRQILNAIFWLLHTGAPWRDLPERFGPWQTVYNTFSRWRAAGVFDRILEALRIQLDRDGHIDWELWCIDGSHVRASRAAAGADKKVSHDTAMNRPIMRWAAAEAGLDRSFTWLLTAREFR